MLSTKYGKRNQEIKQFFQNNGLYYCGKSPRDISFGRGKVFITDQETCFAIYARGNDAEKNVFLRIFEKYDPIPGSIKREPEASAPRKCCARWEHSPMDEEIMLNVVREVLSAAGY